MAGRPNPQGRLKLILAPCYRSTAMRACIAIVFLLLIDPGWALDLVIKDGDTLTLDGTEFRLDGIDAPEKDQVCVDDKGALWACGIEARDHLAALIGERAVRCEDMGADPFYPKRRIGRCSAEGENMTLNQRLVREGWALSFEPYAKGRFKPGGIYHMEGCRSYVSTKKPNRWFCSEEEARAAGFRKSYRC